MTSDASITDIGNQILAKRILVAKFEIMLYALPDDFTMYVDDEQQPITGPYSVTRNRKAYEHSEASSGRYRQLVSSTGMYNIIKRHLSYEKRQLEELEADYGEPVQFKDKKLTRYTSILEQLRIAKGTTILLELQPRWMRRSNDEDDLYEEAVSLVARTQIADVTLIRDNLSIGHTQAGVFVQKMEAEGLVSELSKSALKRSVFITVDDMDAREAKNHANK